MVTVTFPFRPAIAPSSERATSVAVEDGGFGALFALLQSGSSSVEDVARASAEDGCSAGSAPQEPAPEADGEEADTAAEDSAPQDGPAVMLAALLSQPVLVATESSGTGSVEAARASQATLRPVTSDGTMPALSATAEGASSETAPQDPMSAMHSLPPDEPVQAAHQPQAASIPDETSSFPSSVDRTPLAVSGSPADAAFVLEPPVANRQAVTPLVPLLKDNEDAGAPAEQTGESAPLVLAQSVGPTPRHAPLSFGMPAFWAAREAAENEGNSPGSSLLNAPSGDREAPAPISTLGPQSDADATLAEADLASLQHEARAVPAQTPLQSLVTGLAAPAPGPTLPPTSLPPALPPQVPAQIAAAVASRPERPLELRLVAAELGGLTLNLQQDGSILRVTVQADRPDTLDLLRRYGDILVQELKLAGFTAASLSFADGGGAQQRPAAPPASGVAAVEPPPPPVTLPAATLAAHSAQGLDLRL